MKVRRKYVINYSNEEFLIQSTSSTVPEWSYAGYQTWHCLLYQLIVLAGQDNNHDNTLVVNSNTLKGSWQDKTRPDMATLTDNAFNNMLLSQIYQNMKNVKVMYYSML